MRILVVDDNDWVRRGVIGILASRSAWEICGEATDGEEAIAKARELSPDLVLLDISMPGMNGLEVARLLRQSVPAAKILIMSQHDPVHMEHGAIQAGAQGCVDKSRLATDLLPRIDSIAGTSEAHGVGNAS